jgi:hypothetical protein
MLRLRSDLREGIAGPVFILEDYRVADQGHTLKRFPGFVVASIGQASPK